MALLDRLGETQLGLGGVRPVNLPSSKNTSKTHAIDPVHGKRGDEKVSFDSKYDRDGETPKTLSFSLGTSNTHVNDPDAVANPQFVHQVTPRSTVLNRRTNNTISFDSKYDLDGKTPEISPFASRTSPTHVIDPDAIKDIQNDPILGKNTKIQKMMQGIRRANNTLVAQSNFDLDGKTPSKLSSAFRNSNTHVEDPNAKDPTDVNLSREQVLANRKNNVLKAKSDFDLDGKTPSTLSSAFRSSNTHVNDPNANDPTDVNLTREQVLANRTNNVLKAQSNFDLDGKTPSTLSSAFRTSNTHVNDPNANDPTDVTLTREQVLANRTNNVLKAQSNFDLDGKTPSTLPSAFGTSNTHVNDPNATIGELVFQDTPRSTVLDRRTNNTVTFDSRFDLDGKTPSILPSATRGSATHVYDPDFSINQINDPLLSLRGKRLKKAQNARRSNNTLTFQSAYAPPQSQTKYTSTNLSGGNPSNFSSDSPITRD